MTQTLSTSFRVLSPAELVATVIAATANMLAGTLLCNGNQWTSSRRSAGDEPAASSTVDMCAGTDPLGRRAETSTSQLSYLLRLISRNVEPAAPPRDRG